MLGDAEPAAGGTAPQRRSFIDTVMSNTQRKKALLSVAVAHPLHPQQTAHPVTLHSLSGHPNADASDASDTTPPDMPCELIVTPHGFHLLRCRDLAECVALAWSGVEQVAATPPGVTVTPSCTDTPPVCIHCPGGDGQAVFGLMSGRLREYHRFLGSKGIAPPDSGAAAPPPEVGTSYPARHSSAGSESQDFEKAVVAPCRQQFATPSDAALIPAGGPPGPLASQGRGARGAEGKAGVCLSDPAERARLLEWYKEEWSAAEGRGVSKVMERLQEARRWKDPAYCEGLGEAAAAAAGSVAAAHEDWVLSCEEVQARRVIGEFWSQQEHLGLLQRLRQGCAVEAVCCGRRGMDDELLQVLLEHLADNGQTKCLKIPHSPITDAGVAALCDMLLPGTVLSTLDLTGCGFLTRKSLDRLVEAAHEHVQLRHVSLSRPCGVSDADMQVLEQTTMLNLLSGISAA